MKKKRLLIIEDELPMLNVLSDRFTLENYEVIKASDGSEGLRLARSKKPDLILMDLILPNMEGQQILSNIRQSVAGKKTPVIILTNVNPDDSLLESISKYNPSYYLIKSNLKVEELVEIVRGLIAEK